MNEILANKQIDRLLEVPSTREFWRKHFDGKLNVDFETLTNLYPISFLKI